MIETVRFWIDAPWYRRGSIKRQVCRSAKSYGFGVTVTESKNRGYSSYLFTITGDYRIHVFKSKVLNWIEAWYGD